jgi:nitroreductase
VKSVPSEKKTEAFATFERIVATRRSVRAFLPTPLPQAMIEQLLTTAGKAPSNCNVQPWIVHVVSGDALARLRAALIEEAKAGRLDPDVPITRQYEGDYKARRIGAAVALFSATGVGRDDEEARTRSYLRNYAFFDAPHVAFFFMAPGFGLREAADIGMYAQTLMLALTALGLGSCAQGAISHYAGAVKRELGVPADLVCLFGLSFGYPDERDPSVAAITDRVSLDETVTFHA